jgi:hypothetical protein
MQELLNYATREGGGNITFGVQFDRAEASWMGAMSSGTEKVLFPPGAGRKFARELRERATRTMASLSDEAKAQVGAEQFFATFDQIEKACKTAMERNAAKVGPEFFDFSDTER